MTPEAALEAAAAQPVGAGVSLRFPSAAAAQAFRFRCYAARRRIRALLLRTMAPSAEDFGQTPFDGVEIRAEAPNILWIGVPEPAEMAPSAIEVGVRQKNDRRPKNR